MTFRPAFAAGSAARIDAMMASYPAPWRDWHDICSSQRIPPEWTAGECLSLTSPAPQEEGEVRAQIGGNRDRVVATLDRLGLDGLVYLTDLRGGARADGTEGFTCFVASTSGLPAMALPVGLDTEGMPVGVEILGRPGSDEALVAMAAAFEQARGPLPPAPQPTASAELASLGIAAQNGLRLFLGWSAFKSRQGKELGDLEPQRFQAFVRKTVDDWTRGARP